MKFECVNSFLRKKKSSIQYHDICKLQSLTKNIQRMLKAITFSRVKGITEVGNVARSCSYMGIEFEIDIR